MFGQFQVVRLPPRPSPFGKIYVLRYSSGLLMCTISENSPIISNYKSRDDEFMRYCKFFYEDLFWVLALPELFKADFIRAPFIFFHSVFVVLFFWDCASSVFVHWAFTFIADCPAAMCYRCKKYIMVISISDGSTIPSFF